jgi:hypothetical protein
MLLVTAFALFGASSASATVCGTPNAYSAAVLADGPLSYFRLDEPGGSTICDSSATPTNGTYGAGVSYGTAGATTGDAAITATAGIGNAGPGVSGSHDFTLEGWFRRTTTTQDQTLVAIGAAGKGHIAGLNLWTTTTTGSYPIAAASSIGLDTYESINQWDTAPAGVNLWDGKWHYVAVTYSAATGVATAYVDGQSLGTRTPVALSITAAPILLGRWVDTVINKPLIGSANAIAVYPTALPAGRIAAHYQAAAASAGPDGSATQLICNYEVASSQDVCTATVGDIATPPTAPTGTVTFTSASGGSFPFGSTCTLAGTPASVATTSCSVPFVPFNFPTVFPHLTATYSGDARHGPSSGSTFLGGLGNPNEQTPPPTTAKEEGTGQIGVTVDVPASAVAVTACALNGGASASSAGLLDSITSSLRSETSLLAKDVARTAGTVTPSLANALNGDLQGVSGGLGQLQQQLQSIAGPATPPLSLPALESVMKALIQQQKAAQNQTEIEDALKQVQIDQAQTVKLIQNLQSQCTAAPGATTSSVAVSAAKKHPKHGRALAVARRRNVHAGVLHLKLHISLATLKRLAKGKKRITLLVPINMVLPSKRFNQGFPLLSVQHVTLSFAKHKKK